MAGKINNTGNPATSTKHTSIYISTFPNALASKKAQNHEIRIYFLTKSIVALCHATFKPRPCLVKPRPCLVMKLNFITIAWNFGFLEYSRSYSRGITAKIRPRKNYEINLFKFPVLHTWCFTE